MRLRFAWLFLLGACSGNPESEVTVSPLECFYHGALDYGFASVGDGVLDEDGAVVLGQEDVRLRAVEDSTLHVIVELSPSAPDSLVSEIELVADACSQHDGE